MRKRNYSLIILCLAILAVWLVPRVVREDIEQTGCELLKVVDGDTLTVLYEGEKVNVRLIGVDAPESVHPEESQNSELGELASAYLTELLKDTAYVYLEFDQEKYDSYERLLAYVYLAEDVAFQESLNFRLVQDGYAINKEYKPNVRYANELERICCLAKEQKCGLWRQEEMDQIWN